MVNRNFVGRNLEVKIICMKQKEGKEDGVDGSVEKGGVRKTKRWEESEYLLFNSIRRMIDFLK